MNKNKRKGRTYLGTGVTSIIIALIVLALASFSALAFVSANSEMKITKRSVAYNDNYYAAETTATEIVSGISTNNMELFEDKNGSLVYNSVQGDIVISRSGNTVSFLVPINDKQNLNVKANAGAGDINVIDWFVE